MRTHLFLLCLKSVSNHLVSINSELLPCFSCQLLIWNFRNWQTKQGSGRVLKFSLVQRYFFKVAPPKEDILFDHHQWSIFKSSFFAHYNYKSDNQPWWLHKRCATALLVWIPLGAHLWMNLYMGKSSAI